MTQIMQDKYILGQSISSSIQNIGEEIQLNLSLKANTNDIAGGTITGTITDSSKKPIPNAYVKLMTKNYNPVIHAITDVDGKFSLINIPIGSYNIFAIATGMNLNQQVITLTKYQYLILNFILTEDTSMTFSIIAGDLINRSTKEPVGGAVVSLFLNVNNTETLTAITYTNQYGQFVFRHIPNGNYIIEISALGYETKKSTISVTTSGQIVSLNESIAPTAKISKGTVSGIIQDNENQPVINCDVILYNVNTTNNILTPIAFTKTNKNGVYLFINVPQGNYKIKSNKLELVQATIPPKSYSPDFYSFTVATPLTYIPLQVSATKGVLSNGATIDTTNNFVTNLGGATNGTVTLKVSVSVSSNYTLGIQYVATTQGTKLQVQTNGGSIITTDALPPTADLTEADSKTTTLTVALNSGTNTIKIFNTNASAPNINNLFFSMLPITINTTAVDGTLAGGAYVDYGFVLFIGGTPGGTQFGSVTVNVDVVLSGDYDLKIQYQSGDGPRVLEIDVNGASTGQSYTVPQTTNWNPDVFLYYTVTVSLNSGTNTIKLYNNNNWAPNIGTLTFTQKLVLETYKAENTTVIPPATIENGMVIGIGYGQGSLTFLINVPGTGLYDFIIKYVANTNNKVTNININGVFTGKTYMFTQTASQQVTDTENKVILLTLNKGNNTIKIYNAT